MDMKEDRLGQGQAEIGCVSNLLCSSLLNYLYLPEETRVLSDCPEIPLSSASFPSTSRQYQP